jgi:hypothetical protein
VQDLVPVPQPPEYGFKDKWTVRIVEPPAMGGQVLSLLALLLLYFTTTTALLVQQYKY